MSEDHFAGEIARSYDHDAARMFGPGVLEPTVDVLTDLAEGGPVLELGVGTGRVALPLAARGLEVSGIDRSPDMLAELGAKPGAERVTTVVGDMTSTTVDGEFSLVVLVFNTISNLTTQDDQVACFENAARHLRPGGRFVIENGVPPLRRLSPGNSVVPFAVSDDYLGFDEFTDRTHLQTFRSRHLRRRPEGHFLEVAVPFRYVWPSELDLMARIAGMSLEHRWSGWHRSAFEGDSDSHVSVWRRDPS